jgi:hypothetical protein
MVINISVDYVASGGPLVPGLLCRKSPAISSGIRASYLSWGVVLCTFTMIGLRLKSFDHRSLDDGCVVCRYPLGGHGRGATVFLGIVPVSSVASLDSSL